MFPNLKRSLLLTNNLQIASANSSCLLNRTSWKFDNSINSSLTILSDSLRFNQTYLFIVHMESLLNSSLQFTGYTFVSVENTSSQMILIRSDSSFLRRSKYHQLLCRCVILTLCETNLQFQYVNPTTQVALVSECAGNCTALQNITWNVYYGTVNASSNYTIWTLFNQTTAYQDIWFFGKL